jgi:hypothetical protein
MYGGKDKNFDKIQAQGINYISLKRFKCSAKTDKIKNVVHIDGIKYRSSKLKN